jgi:hypothetical protein
MKDVWFPGQRNNQPDMINFDIICSIDTITK